MAEIKKTIRLKKEITLLGVYAIAAGTTLSAGFFLLPGLAAQEAGSALIFAYIIAALPLIPAMFSVIELATAMPRAGGVYYFLDRTLGPFFGTIGGIGTWLALILKVAFALIGMGAYVKLFLPSLPIIPLAIGFAVLLGLLNLFGAKKSGSFQVILVFGLISILTVFISGGMIQLEPTYFADIFDFETSSLLGTAGLVYISYVGITKVASLSEEVKDPEKNLPKGVIYALSSAILIYVLGTTVMVGVLPMETLKGNLTPVAAAAEVFLGEYGSLLLSIAALLAFVSVANAGILSASRYPLAMSRDHIMPRLFQKMGKIGSPYISIIITVLAIVIILVGFNPTKIAKLASAFQLLMFALVCFAVIVMRESKIESYDPGYYSPWYPWMQIFGILGSFVLIIEMGTLPSLFSAGLILIGYIWYRYYVKKRVLRTGAIYHIFERLGKFRYAGLDRELRGILKEKGLRSDDPFDDIVARSKVFDFANRESFDNIVKEVSLWISGKTPYTAAEIEKQFLEGTRMGATPVTNNMALPHLRIKGIDQAVMVLVRAKGGAKVLFNNPMTDNEFEEEAIVNAIFFLVSPDSNPTQHLRILAQIAGRVEDDSFMNDWNKAANDHEIKLALLHDDRYLSIIISENDGTSIMVGKELKDILIPSGCLVAWVRREDQMMIPKGNTIFQKGDLLTIIGEPDGMKEIRKLYRLN
ncbi:MAG: amino acid permease [Melioribacteraceae bacterium]|nr:amino acid permease [Melioribacteraceae bacterium]